MNRFLQVFYVIFSAIITSLAIPNEILLFGSPVLGLIALIPLYLALARCKTFLCAGLLTSLQMFITHTLSSFWLGYFKDFALLTLGATATVYILLGFFLGQLFFIPFYFTKKAKLAERAALCGGGNLFTWNSPIRILMFATLWTLYEWYKSTGFLGYPWGTLIMTAWKWNIVTQIVSFTGTWGLSFLFALANAVIAEGILLVFKIPPQKFFITGSQNHINDVAQVPDTILTRLENAGGMHFSIAYFCRKFTITNTHSYICTALFCLTLFACTVFFGIYEYTKERIPIKTVKTILVQPNTDSWLTLNDANAIAVGQRLTEEALIEYEKQPDIVLWSEAILGKSYPDAEPYYQRFPTEKPLTQFIAEVGVPFIMGGPVEINQDEYEEKGRRQLNNGALYYDKYGNWLDFYGKIKLVPFAEIIPYADNKWIMMFMESVVKFSSGWVQGEEYTLFEIPLDNGESVKVSTPICFEDAFPMLCRDLFFAGSEAFFNITNDAWSLKDSAEIQHFVISSYRAQEFRTTLVRSTNAGFSTVTDPAGRILYSLPLFESVGGGFDVPIYERQLTIYAIFGNWVPQLLGAVYIVFYIGVYIKIKKSKNDIFRLY